MSRVLCLRVTWRETALTLNLPQFGELNLQPETGHLKGRKGLRLQQAWQEHGQDCAGLLLLDGDVACDPADIQAMLDAISEHPGIVHVAPARLWLRKPGTRWMWGHRRKNDRRARYRELVPDPLTFSFCLTYVPGELIEACILAGLETWEYPAVDLGFMRAARLTGIPVAVVPGSRPVHMHY